MLSTPPPRRVAAFSLSSDQREPPPPTPPQPWPGAPFVSRAVFYPRSSLVSTLHSHLDATSTKEKGKEIETHALHVSEICSLFRDQGRTTHSPPAQGRGYREVE